MWEETGDLLEFMSLVREMRTEAELDAILVRLGVDPATITVE